MPEGIRFVTIGLRPQAAALEEPGDKARMRSVTRAISASLGGNAGRKRMQPFLSSA